MCDDEHEMNNLLIAQFADVHREHDFFSLWPFVNEKLTFSHSEPETEEQKSRIGVLLQHFNSNDVRG